MSDVSATISNQQSKIANPLGVFSPKPQARTQRSAFSVHRSAFIIQRSSFIIRSAFPVPHVGAKLLRAGKRALLGEPHGAFDHLRSFTVY